MIFWAIDGPEFGDIKGSDFEAKMEKETDGRKAETDRERLVKTESERSRR